MHLHHAAICTGDIESSVAFWRDGVGLTELMDETFEGDWPTLFGSTSSRLRSVFLGDPAGRDSGVVELVDFGEPVAVSPPDTGPRAGFFLLSFYVDLGTTLARLAGLDLGGEPRVIEVHGVRMAVVTDPNGVRVELIDLPTT
jgi:catechol 2,3-dioxygenase-like lactoylglutathione lyase family enzyme